MSLEYASKIMRKDGEEQCGDAVFARIEGDVALFALLDGLGHGEGAAEVAQLGLSTLSELPAGVDAVTALDALNVELHGTRGAAATILSFQGRAVQIAGVGNVACRAIGSRCSFVPTPGVLGFRRQVHSILRLSMAAGQRLLLHTDGVSSRFEPQLLYPFSPQMACDFLLRHFRHAHDDASVLVVGASNFVGSLP
jgi:negative regulator of sigma-B (phosphoserine phosphatase)